MTPSPRDSDGDGVPDYLDNCPFTPNADQTDSALDGVGDGCRPPTLLHSTAAFLQANVDGETDVTAQDLTVSAEPNATVVIMKIVEFRVSSGMTSPADAATLTQTLVSSQVDIGLITQSQATAVVTAVASVVDTLAPTWASTNKVTVSDIGQTSLTLTWTVAADDFQVTNYRIYEGSALIATVAGSVYTYTVTGLSPGTSYTFTVQAGDGANNWSNNGPSTPASTLASPSPVPPAPTPTIFGLAPWLFYSIVGGVVVLIAVICAGIIVSRKRRGTSVT